MRPRPTSGRHRIQLLDALRGFALLGVFVGNIQFLSGADVRLEVWPDELDESVRWWVHFAVRGKFYTLFALLFGIGFGVQISRSVGDRAAVLRFRRRMGILLGIGLAHFLLLWPGDILVLYAALAFVLPAFWHRRQESLLRWALVLFVAPVVLHGMALVGAAYYLPPIREVLERDPRQVLALYRHGTFLDVLRDNFTREGLDRVVSLVATGRVFKVLATFILGVWVWRRGIPSDPARHGPLLRRTLLMGLALGVIGSAGLATMLDTDAYASLAPVGLLQSVLYALGVPSFALALAAGFALAFQRPQGRWLLMRFAPAGRMALTNYIGQTLMATLLFYGYGLGLFGRVRFTTAVIMAIALFVAQVVASELWLRRFRYGPLEWLWRCLTYRQRLPLLAPTRE